MFLKDKKQGFSLPELIVVILVIAILAGVGYVGWGSWRKSVAEKEVKTNLQSSQSAMSDDKNWNNGYPVNPSFSGSNAIFKPSKNIVVNYMEGDSKGYCLDGFSTAVPGVRYFINTLEGTDPIKGSCLTGEEPDIAGTYYLTQTATQSNLSCGLGNNAVAYCWGENVYGGLGTASPLSNGKVPSPVTMSGPLAGKFVLQVTEDCLIASDSKGYCWGKNDGGRIGNGTTSDSVLPVPVSDSGTLAGKTLRQIVSRNGNTCAVSSDGLAYCWGYNSAGQLGINSASGPESCPYAASMYACSRSPVAVDMSGVLAGKTIQAITIGVENGNGPICAIVSDGLAYCWGYNNSGSLGNGTFGGYSTVPVAVNMPGNLAGKTIKKISSGMEHTCAIASDNLAYCWGYNSSGQLGNNSTTRSSVPVAVNTSGVLSGKTIKNIAAGNNYTCAIASDYKAYCWGQNYRGMLGNGTYNGSTVPVMVDTSGVLAGKNLTHIAAGGSGGNGSTCAVATDGNTYCWGYNQFGQLGNITVTASTSNVPVVVTKP